MTMRVSQAVVEVLVSSLGTPRIVSQIVAEILGLAGGGNFTVRVSQAVAEILIWTQILAGPPVYPTLPGLAYSVIKRPVFYTGRAKSGSGWQVRLGYSQYPTWEWDLSYDQNNGGFLRDTAAFPELKTLIGFYLAMGGDLTPFLFVDPDDNQVTGQLISGTDGVMTQFLMLRSLGGTDGAGAEPIGFLNTTAPYTVYLDGVPVSGAAYTINTSIPGRQLLTFTSPPTTGKVITMDFQFYYYVHFKDQQQDFEKFMNHFWSVGKITLESLRG